MTDESKKPEAREFWIYNGGPNEYGDYYANPEKPGFLHLHTHVIEYSAYQEKVDELAKLKADFQTMHDNTISLSLHESRMRNAESKNAELNKVLFVLNAECEELKKRLEFICCGGNDDSMETTGYYRAHNMDCDLRAKLTLTQSKLARARKFFRSRIKNIMEFNGYISETNEKAADDELALLDAYIADGGGDE